MPLTRISRCLIVKTDTYTREEIAKVVQVRANVEGLKLGSGVLDRLASDGERSSLRLVLLPVHAHRVLSLLLPYG